MALQVLSCRIPSGDNPHCGVTLEPYVVVKRSSDSGGLPSQVNAADLPGEGTDARFYVRSRWYRSVLSRGGSVCCIHPDREATIQCLLCLRCKVDSRRSFHCSTDCLKQHWGFHKELHEQVRNGTQRITDNVTHHVHLPAAGNGYSQDATAPKEGANGEAWVEVKQVVAFWLFSPTDTTRVLTYHCAGCQE